MNMHLLLVVIWGTKKYIRIDTALNMKANQQCISVPNLRAVIAPGKASYVQIRQKIIVFLM